MPVTAFISPTAPMKPEPTHPRRNRAQGLVLWLLGGLALCVAISCGGGEDGEENAPDQPPADTTNLIAEALPRFKADQGKPWPAPTPRMTQIHQALNKNDLKTARQLLQQEINEDPDSDEAHFLIAEVRYSRSRFGLANETFEKVLREGPTFPRSELAFYFYGVCQMRLGNVERARESLLAILELRPKYGEALFALGLLEVQRGKPELAIVFFEEAMYYFKEAQAKGRNRDEPLARTYSGLGDSYLQTGKLEKAQQYLEQGIELNPSDAKAHYALSRVLHRLGDAEGAQRAMAEFEKLSAQQNAKRPADGEKQ